MSDWHASRQIIKRIVVEGSLVLTTSTHLGAGEHGDQVDMPLLRDPLEERPLLMGTSIAGALRGYLQARQRGYFISEEEGKPQGEDSFVLRSWSEQHKAESDAARLFGGSKGDEYGDQSPLIIEDALAALTPVEIRDGVRIDGTTRTAADQFKYDLELLPVGTTFPLRFELLISENDDAAQLIGSLALALHGLETGAISLGARKSRGFGRCEVQEWRVTTYTLQEPAELLAWLTVDYADWGYALPADTTRVGKAADVLFPVEASRKHKIFTLIATFALDSSMLIRSEEPLTDSDNQPDFIHLRDGLGRRIISGTSLAGALRTRALRIVNTLQVNHTIIDTLFGNAVQAQRDKQTASRLIVEEAVITSGRTLVQNRVAIDRFTGGALDTALFSEAPQIGGEATLQLTIRKPEAAHIGLLLLLLKDLWTSDLPLGGTSSIGRGRLRGQHATLRYDNGTDTTEEWTIEANDTALTIDGDKDRLEAFVSACVEGKHE